MHSLGVRDEQEEGFLAAWAKGKRQTGSVTKEDDNLLLSQPSSPCNAMCYVVKKIYND